MSITNSKKYQRLGDKDGNPLNGGKTLTHGGGRTYAQDLALQEQHRQLIEKILSGDMQSGLVFTCQIGGLPEETFQVTQFDLQEGISQLF
ncbi:type VI secretion system tip protein VgrG, partial [Proteus mirabilis]|nr:type VI secretion system tip protein VgrG [Proteus mirabilis]MDK7020739.1 type VI secretion system tip protein VgrG [Proteus mirabilis]